MVENQQSLDGNQLPALDDPTNVRRWLQTYHPKQLALLDNFEISLRLGRFSSRGCDGSETPSNINNVGGGTSINSTSSSHQTYQYGRERRLITTRTVELLRAIIGPTKWKTAAQLLTLLRGLGNELHAAGGYREPAIGNMVRRIMYAVRDEADRVGMVSMGGGGGGSDAIIGGSGDDDNTTNDMEKIDELTEQVSTKIRISDHSRSSVPPARDSLTKGLSLTSMLWAHPQHVTNMKHTRTQSGDFNDRLRSDSFGSTESGVPSLNLAPSNENAAQPMYYYPPHYYNKMTNDLRQSVMEAIQEMMSELEDLHKNINEQAVQHIHAGEIILTYALSKTVELVSYCFACGCCYLCQPLIEECAHIICFFCQFLKAAAAKKRKFSVIV